MKVRELIELLAKQNWDSDAVVEDEYSAKLFDSKMRGKKILHVNCWGRTVRIVYKNKS